MKKIAAAATLVFIWALQVQAQTSSLLTTESDITPKMTFGQGKIIAFAPFFSTYFANIYDGSRSVVYLNETEAVVAVTTRKDPFNGISRINNKGKVLWTTMVANLLSVSKSGNNLLVLSSDFFGFNCWTSITARVIDAGTGAEISKKVIYERKDQQFKEHKILNDSSNTFQGLLIMHSTHVCEGHKKYKQDEMFVSKDLMDGGEIINTDGNSNWSSTPLQQSMFSGSGASFAGATANSKGEIFISGLGNGKLFVEKYSAGTNKFVKRIETNFEAKTDQYFNGIITQMGDDATGVTIKAEIGKNDQWMKEAVFDFAAQTVHAATTTIDKSFGKSMNIDDADKLEAEAFLKYGDKYIVVKQAEYKYTVESQSPSATAMVSYSADKFSAGDIIVSIYDRNMVLQKNIAINKSYTYGLNMGMLPGVKIINNNLYIIFNAIPKVFTALSERKSKVARINLDTPATAEVTDIDRGALNNSDIMEPSVALWFGKSALIPYLRVDKNKSYNNTKASVSHYEFFALYQAVKF